MLPDLERAERIGEFCSYPQSRTFAELLSPQRLSSGTEGRKPCPNTRARARSVIGIGSPLPGAARRADGLDTGRTFP